MSRRLLPPPPLIAPTPSKTRPDEPPLTVIEASAWAAGAELTDSPAAARSAAARPRRNLDMTGGPFSRGPLLVARAGAGGELDQGAVGGGGSGDVEAEPGLDPGDGAVRVRGPLLVGLAVAVPDDDLGARAGALAAGVQAAGAVVDGQLTGARVGPGLEI